MLCFRGQEIPADLTKNLLQHIFCTFYPVLIPDHSPVAAPIIVTIIGTVEQSFVRIFVKGSVAVAVTTGGSNLAVEIAEAQLAFDESWKQTGEDCDGQRRYLHLID